jgi:hypothetical protein
VDGGVVMEYLRSKLEAATHDQLARFLVSAIHIITVYNRDHYSDCNLHPSWVARNEAMHRLLGNLGAVLDDKTEKKIWFDAIIENLKVIPEKALIERIKFLE